MKCCNFNCVAVLLNYIVTLVRLSLVTNKGYLLTYLLSMEILAVERCLIAEMTFKVTQGHCK